jgi:CRP-like cAMP-binding protein
MGGEIVDVYFPIGAVISLVTLMSDGKIVEVGLIGNEGMSGLAGILGAATSPEQAIVQIPDSGFRAKLNVMREEFKLNSTFQTVVLAYARKHIMQISQTAACNAIHSIEERLSRWLLMCQDRVEKTELNLTQEFIAEMLATRRASVSVAAMVLQTEGLIKYRRGHIEILDRMGLEAFACECYRAQMAS